MSSTHYEVRGNTAVITLANGPMNGLSYALRGGVVAGIDQATADPAVTAIVLIGSDRAFSSGADIREFGTPKAYAQPNLPTTIGIVEASRKPVIAAISGVCMGGGFELTLGAHFRLARPDAKIALPEVKLGLIPGAGGTQRGPRILGVETALNLMLKGETLPASAFQDTPLIDQYVTDGDLLTAALTFADRVVAEKRPLRRISEMRIDYPQHQAYLQFVRNMIKGIAGPFPAPGRCVDAVAAALTLPFAEGIKVERESFLALMTTPESAALRYLFAAERAAAKIADIPDDTPTRPITRVGVIGAGTMGSGIAMNFLNAGIPVTLLDAQQSALDQGIASVRKHYQSSLKKGKLTQEKLDQRLALLGSSLSYDALKDCDLIIEAVFEDLGVKQAVFEKLDAIAKPGAILASNTSTLDVNTIARFTRRPQDVVGLHFFSPAQVMKLLEVVRGSATAHDVMASVMQLAKKIKKTAVVSGVCDGFIGNRMVLHYLRMAVALVEEGASVQQVDAALEKFGMLMGPFRMADLAGNDIGWHIRQRHYVERPDIVYSKLADRLCEAGRLGQKTGKGWYAYPPGARAPQADAEVTTLIERWRQEAGITPRRISDTEIVERCLYALINEGARLLDEGIAARASDIDLVYLTGYGFPMHRGGPLFHADQIGLYTVARRMSEFAAASGDAFWQPAPLIARLAAEGRRLT